MMSFSVNRILSPMKYPLLRMERWESMAALGMAVVPDVNWMLITSSGCKGEAGFIPPRPWPPEFHASSNLNAERRRETSMREEELSTTMMCFREGTEAD